MSWFNLICIIIFINLIIFTAFSDRLKFNRNRIIVALLFTGCILTYTISYSIDTYVDTVTVL